jgi:hypothetical protein
VRRKRSYRRRLAFPTTFRNAVTDHQTGPTQSSFANPQPGSPMRRIFIIKQVRQFSTTSLTDRKIRRILIFDNHPDSLRLLFSSDSNPDGNDLSEPRRVSIWQLALVLTLVVVAFVGILWPIL